MMYFKDLGNSEKSKPKLKERSNKNQSRNKDEMIKNLKILDEEKLNALLSISANVRDKGRKLILMSLI